MSAKPLAVFDLDGTLLRRDSFLPFLLSFTWRKRRFASLPAFPLYIGLYLSRMMSDYRAKERLIRAVCSGESLLEIGEHAARFCDSWVDKHWRTTAVECLRLHQQQGFRVVLLSASPDLYVPVIAQRLGIEEVVCTRVAVDEGRCTGFLLGENCKGITKLHLLQNYLAMQSPPPNSVAYGDQAHDRFVLRWVSQGYLWNYRTEAFEPIGPAGGR